MDFIIEHKGTRIAIECKASVSPSLTRGNRSAIEDIRADRVLVVSPVENGWDMKDGVKIVTLDRLVSLLGELV